MNLVVRPDNNPQTRLFIFMGRQASFPLSPGQRRTFYNSEFIEANKGQKLLSAEDADKQGYILIHKLIKDPLVKIHPNRFQSATAETIQLKSGVVDMVSVTLKDEYKWSDNNFEDVITNSMRNNFVDRKIPPYRATDTTLDPEAMVEKVNEWIESTEGIEDPRLAVFKTVKKDQGNVQARSFDPKEGTLYMAFSGACASNCVQSDTSMTKISIAGAITYYHADIRRVAFPN